MTKFECYNKQKKREDRKMKKVEIMLSFLVLMLHLVLIAFEPISKKAAYSSEKIFCYFLLAVTVGKINRRLEIKTNPRVWFLILFGSNSPQLAAIKMSRTECLIRSVPRGGDNLFFVSIPLIPHRRKFVPLSKKSENFIRYPTFLTRVLSHPF